MNDSTIQQLTTALKPLADKIGQGAEKIWEAYYRQAIINAITVIVFWTVMLVATIGITIAVCRYQDRRKKNDRYSVYDVSPEAMKLWAIGIGGFFCLVWIGIIIIGGIQPLLNPVYQTTHDIIGELRPKAD